MSESNHDSEWLQKMSEKEDGADCSVGSLPTEKQMEDFISNKNVDPGPGSNIQVLPDGKNLELPKPPVPQITPDQKQLLMNRVKRMQKKARKLGTLYSAIKVGEIIVMSDRHYITQKDGSFKFVRMLNR